MTLSLLALLGLALYLAGWVSMSIIEDNRQQAADRAEARRHIRAILRSTTRHNGNLS